MVERQIKFTNVMTFLSEAPKADKAVLLRYLALKVVRTSWVPYGGSRLALIRGVFT